MLDIRVRRVEDNIPLYYREAVNEYYADAVNLPGTPPIGRGPSVEAAIGRLIINLDRDMKLDADTWHRLGAPKVTQEDE